MRDIYFYFYSCHLKKKIEKKSSEVEKVTHTAKKREAIENKINIKKINKKSDNIKKIIIFFQTFQHKNRYLLGKTTKILMQCRCIWIKIIYVKYMSFMLYVTDLIRHLVNLLFIQRITMFTQIITMFTHYFKECQPFLLTFTTWFSKSWHRLNEPLKDYH